MKFWTPHSNFYRFLKKQQYELSTEKYKDSCPNYETFAWQIYDRQQDLTPAAETCQFLEIEQGF